MFVVGLRSFEATSWVFFSKSSSFRRTVKKKQTKSVHEKSPKFGFVYFPRRFLPVCTTRRIFGIDGLPARAHGTSLAENFLLPLPEGPAGTPAAGSLIQMPTVYEGARGLEALLKYHKSNILPKTPAFLSEGGF